MVFSNSRCIYRFHCLSWSLVRVHLLFHVYPNMPGQIVKLQSTWSSVCHLTLIAGNENRAIKLSLSYSIAIYYLYPVWGLCVSCWWKKKELILFWIFSRIFPKYSKSTLRNNTLSERSDKILKEWYVPALLVILSIQCIYFFLH